MENNTITSSDNKELAVYFILAYAISWAIGIPLALAKQGMIQPIFPFWFHYLVAYGPLLSALIVTWTMRGPQGIKELWERITHGRVGGAWWLVGFSPLLIGLILLLVVNVL